MAVEDDARFGECLGPALEYQPILSVASLIFGSLMAVLIGFNSRDLKAAVWGGLISGVVFALLIKAFQKRVVSSLVQKVHEGESSAAQSATDEEIVHSGPANRFKSFQAVGGVLLLSRKRLRFLSHAFNVGQHDISFAIDSIASVEPARTFGLIPNGLLLTLRDGQRERFAVSARDAWLATIRKAISSCESGITAS